MLKKIIYPLLLTVLTVAVSSCLNNDIPYPRLQANFLTIVAEGESQPAVIDSINRTVVFTLPEEVNIAEVKIASYTLAAGCEAVGDTLDNPFDLSTPKTVTLHKYQDYQWTLSAKQTIERYFRVDGQIGASTIDIPGRRVIAYYPETSDISKVYVESCKLGPTGSTMTPTLEGKYVDFSLPVEVIVDAYGQAQKWTIYVEPTEVKVMTVSADAWTNVAWVYGQCEVGADCGVQYRIEGDTQWTDAPKDWLTVNGGEFHARLIHLSPSTTYEVRTVSGEYVGATLSITTGTVLQLPNSDFESWWLDGKVWCPWAQGGEQYWDTGNKGATTLGDSNVQPTDDTPTGSGRAAILKTEFKGVGLIGKIAAGSIFAGRYVKTDGTNGILSFGRQFTECPTGMRGYYKYTTAPINYAEPEFKSIIGQPDTCIVWVALLDAPQPFEIRTNPKNRQLFNPDAENVVAYGKMEMGQDVKNWIPFEIKLDYKYTNRKPRYILVTASSSKYGDYFTGGTGAVLWLDDYQLIYDY